MTVTEEPENSPPTGGKIKRFFAWFLTWRNVVGAALLLLMIAGLGLYFYEQSHEVTIDCGDAERRGVNESGRLLVTHFDSETTELDAQIAAVKLAKTAKEQDLAELEAVGTQNEADVEAASGKTAATDALNAQILSLQDEIAVLEQDLARLEAEKDNNQLGRERAVAARDADKPPFDADPYSPPRTSLNLQPQEPVTVITLGSDRGPKRAEIVLEQVSTTTSDEAESTDAESTVRTDVAQLPTKPTFLVSAGQFQRSNGLEIPAEDIHAWARWVGSVVLLDVCVDPDARLDPGRFTGDVYLIDPTISPVRVSVEVTAQSTWINWSFLLLFISPLAAFGYVWVVSRHSAGVTPWNMEEFKKWAAQNLVLCLAIGFAAVWATLQVPFNNPTWGSSVIGAAGVIGVGLVAAVTAMTAVAGRVRDN